MHAQRGGSAGDHPSHFGARCTLVLNFCLACLVHHTSTAYFTMARLPQRLGASKKTKAVPKPKAPTPEPVIDAASSDDDADADIPLEGDSDSDSDSDSGVDEAGMKRLMTALGDDGLDEFELAQLGGLQGESDDEESGDEDAEAEDGEELSGSSDDEEADGALSDESEDDEEDDDELEGDDSAAGLRAVALNDDEGDDDDAVALDDAESVDEDAVPRQKIEIDNTVCATPHLPRIVADTSVFVDRYGADQGHHKTGSQAILDRNPCRNVSREDRGRRRGRPEPRGYLVRPHTFLPPPAFSYYMHAAISKHFTLHKPPRPLPQSTTYLSPGRQTTSRRWSSPIRTWSASGSACWTRRPESHARSRSAASVRARSSASRCSLRSSASARRGRRTWRSG
jgi:hypothetical protein